MKLSTRTRLKGRIVGAPRDATTSHVRAHIVTASVTNEAVNELDPADGQPAYAMIKASGVMIANDRPPWSATTRATWRRLPSCRRRRPGIHRPTPRAVVPAPGNAVQERLDGNLCG